HAGAWGVADWRGLADGPLLFGDEGATPMVRKPPAAADFPTIPDGPQSTLCSHSHRISAALEVLEAAMPRKTKFCCVGDKIGRVPADLTPPACRPCAARQNRSLRTRHGPSARSSPLHAP